MFFLGFLGGIVFSVVLTGLVLVITKPWKLEGICDAVLAVARLDDNQAEYGGSLSAAVK